MEITALSKTKAIWKKAIENLSFQSNLKMTRIKEVLRTPKPIHKDRFLGKIFLRVDSVILGVKIGGQMLKWDTSYPDSDNKKPVTLPSLAINTRKWEMV